MLANSATLAGGYRTPLCWQVSDPQRAALTPMPGIAGDAIMSPVELWQPQAKAALYALIATLAVAPLVLGGRGGYARLLSSRPMVWLGEISYEIFLLHVIVMEIAMASVLGWPV